MARILIAGRLASVALLPDVADRLRASGHDVAVHSDPASLDLVHHAAADADVIVVAPRIVASRALMSASDHLRAVVSPITGIDNIDLVAATEMGVLVANGHIPENSISMAEATMLLILAALYDLHGTEAVLRQGTPRPALLNAHMLHGKTVGLLGFGQIARAVAQRLAGWDVSIQAHARRPPDPPPADIRFVALDDLLATSDVVCVLTTLNNESRGLLDAARLRRLKRGAVLVNTARGAIIDEDALCEVARDRPDLRLALDTFAIEPLPASSPLRDLPNAILTPHMLGHTLEAERALVDMAVENTQRILAGDVPRYVCNPDVVSRWQARWSTPPQR